MLGIHHHVEKTWKKSKKKENSKLSCSFSQMKKALKQTYK